MSALADRVDADVKTAMREKNVIARDTLRMVMAGFKNRRIELGRDLEEADEVAVLQKAYKSRLDSAQQYTDAGREELAEKERIEAALIEGYLPQLLDEDATRELVSGIVTALGLSEKKQMGQVMKAVMAEHKGSVDGKLVQKVASELLG